MKVLHVTTRSEFGGMLSMITNLCNRPSDRARLTQELAITPYGAGIDKLQSLGITTYPLHTEQRRSLKLVRELRQIIEESAPDIVHAHDPKTSFLSALALRGKPSIPLVYHVHMAPWWNAGVSWIEITQRIMLRRATLIVSCAEYLRGLMIERFRVDPNRIITVQNAVDTEHFRPVSDAQDTSPNAEHIAHVMCSTRLVEGKGLEDLVTAISLVHVSHPGVRLTIYGEGPLQTKLESLIKKLGLQGSVHPAGPTHEIAKKMSSSDIYAYPSHSEGQSLAILEAMSMAKPIVTTDIPGSKDLIINGKTGMTVPPHEPKALAAAIVRLLEHPELRNRLGNAAREAVLTAHTLPILHRNMDQVYGRLVGGSRGA